MGSLFNLIIIELILEMSFYENTTLEGMTYSNFGTETGRDIFSHTPHFTPHTMEIPNRG